PTLRGKLPVASRLVNGCVQGCPLPPLCRGTVRTITIFAAFARATAAVVRAPNTSMTCERQGHSQDRSRVGLGPPALGSQRTLRWREVDSNPRSPVRGRGDFRSLRKRVTETTRGDLETMST